MRRSREFEKHQRRTEDEQPIWPRTARGWWREIDNANFPAGIFLFLVAIVLVWLFDH